MILIASNPHCASGQPMTSVPCLATPDGEVALDRLRVGDLLLTPHARAKAMPIIWIGRSRMKLAVHRDRAKVATVLVRRGAIADGVPHRDLRVSPDHGFLVAGRLIPARHLVNGITIVQETGWLVATFWHVELPEHAVILVDGAATESYLDDGNRLNFDKGRVVALFKDFESHRGTGRYDAQACFRPLRSGTLLEIQRQRLMTRALDLERRIRDSADGEGPGSEARGSEP